MLHLSSMCNNLTPMGTVPISVIYGFEYSLNGFDQKKITKTKTLHKSEKKKGIIPGEIALKKTRGCLEEMKRLRKNSTTKQITGNMNKNKGCLTHIMKYHKANYNTSRRSGVKEKQDIHIIGFNFYNVF